MAKPNFPYQRLPGGRRGILSGASLWLGTDHILYVKNTRFGEDYRRYYLSDIQAIYLQKMPRFTPPPASVIVVVLGLLFIMILAFGNHPLALKIGWLVLLAVAAHAAWLGLVRSCSCYIKTALGTDRLSCLHRLTSARAAMDQISSRVLETQGPAEGYQLETFVEEPEPVPPPRSREQLFGWLTLPFILISSVLIMRLTVPVPTGPFRIALAAMLPAVICAVLALIAGRGGSRFRVLQGAFLALIVLCGLNLYALVMVDVYSQTALSAAQETAKTMSMLVTAASIGSAWIASANVGVAVVTGLLLLHSRQGSKA